MRTFVDKLISWVGLVLALVLVAGGAALLVASNFVSGQVHDQLVMQDITMPEGDALASLPDADRQALEPFAGSVMDTGVEAKAFADHYILVHMNSASDNRTYEEVSGEFIQMSSDPNADPDELASLGQLRQTLFMGNTLRGLLLNGYAFGAMGVIAGYAAIGCFVAAGVLLVLVFLGFRHARTTQVA